MTPARALTPDAIAGRLRDALAAGSPAGDGAAVLGTEIAQDMSTVTVAPSAWVAALACARDELDCDFFDWLTGVDELDAGVAVLARQQRGAGNVVEHR